MKKARTRRTEEDASFLETDDASARPRRGNGGRRPASTWRRAGYWLLVTGLWAAILGGLGFAYIAWDLPDVEQAIAATRQPTLRVVAQNGQEIARRGDSYGRAVRLEHVPPVLPHAILATEDRRFYDHFGLDVIGIARALVANVRAGGIVQGGSTLTQQAAKNLFLVPERTLKRKLQEVLLALWLEAKFTKDEIFTIYLNRVYFGQGVYGVDAAARYYFATGVEAITPYQCAMLAGMLKGPNRYNPIANVKLARERAEVVLRNMVEAGYFSEADLRAVARPGPNWKAGGNRAAPMAHHFADWVFEQAGDYVSLDQDITIITTIDPAMQRVAEKAVAAMMRQGGAADKRGASEAALVALGPDGGVLAMVGGADYGQSKFNRAVQAKRQPGSAFKPIVFLAGFEAGLTPETRMRDEALSIDGWSPRNFKNEYLGSMTLAEAMTRSINTVAVRVSEHAGRGNVQAMARRLGVTAPLADTPALALGVSEMSLLELTSAYGALATGGIGLWPYAISEIQDAAGRPIYVRTGGGPGRVIPEGYAGAMNGMLAQVLESEYGTGREARLNRPAAGKTGTSQDYRDAWFIGYTPDVIAGVWMGNDDDRAMKGVTGGTLPAVLWKNFMEEALAARRVTPLPSQTLEAGAAKPGPQTPASGAFEDFVKGVFQSIFGN